MLDVVTADAETHKAVFVRMNTGNRQFGAFTEYEIPVTYDIVVADIDGDGHLDIAAGSPLVLLQNDGTGNFTKYGEYPINGEYLRAADMNGDGRIDFVNNANGDLSYWPQSCLP